MSSQEEAVRTTSPPKVVVTRDSLRAKILKTRTPLRKVITFFDSEIELRQPLLGDIVRMRDDDPENRVAVIDTLVKYAFVPGTDEHVFEEGDADVLKSMPFGHDFTAVIEAFSELTEVNFQKPSGN